MNFQTCHTNFNKSIFTSSSKEYTFTGTFPFPFLLIQYPLSLGRSPLNWILRYLFYSAWHSYFRALNKALKSDITTLLWTLHTSETDLFCYWTSYQTIHTDSHFMQLLLVTIIEIVSTSFSFTEIAACLLPKNNLSCKFISTGVIQMLLHQIAVAVAMY